MVAKVEVEKIAAESSFAEAVDVLSDRTITIEVEANEQGHLFKAIKANDIVVAVAEEGITLLPRQIIMEKPLKEVGSHTLNIKSGKHSGAIELNVVSK